MHLSFAKSVLATESQCCYELLSPGHFRSLAPNTIINLCPSSVFRVGTTTLHWETCTTGSTETQALPEHRLLRQGERVDLCQMAGK